MSETTTKPKSLTEACYWAFRADVLSCRLLPGQKIRINEVAAARDVSVGAVREALSRLSAEGLVVAEPQRGFTVAPVSREELMDLTSTRIDLEGACLTRAIEHGQVDWEVGIVAALHRLARIPERVDGDPSVLSDDWASAHRAFHAALVSACDSPCRLRLRASLYDQSERYRRLSVPASARERDLQAEHEALMNAALARQPEEAIRLIDDHLWMTAARVLPLADPAAARQ